MNVKYTIKYNGSTAYFNVNKITECPICKHAINPIFLDGHAFTNSVDTYSISLHLNCGACENSFIAQYEANIYDGAAFSRVRLKYIAPIEFVPEHFEDIITNTSESFVKIYNQSLNAETMKLDEIAGIGYRKALEFLLKDFLILKHPDKKDSIEKSQLGACINNFIDNPQLKTAASRAVWLGNDQTHYIQKFTDKDIDDLKRLIRLTVHWISMILETEEAATIEPIK